MWSDSAGETWTISKKKDVSVILDDWLARPGALTYTIGLTRFLLNGFALIVGSLEEIT